jgi:hypothetical protein
MERRIGWKSLIEWPRKCLRERQEAGIFPGEIERNIGDFNADIVYFMVEIPNRVEILLSRELYRSDVRYTVCRLNRITQKSDSCSLISCSLVNEMTSSLFLRKNGRRKKKEKLIVSRPVTSSGLGLRNEKKPVA